MKRLIRCLLCGLRYDANQHKACPSCMTASTLFQTGLEMNEVISREAFYLSFHSDTYDPLWNLLCGQPDRGGPETAIMFRDNTRQLILRGNHLEALAALGDNPRAVIDYWRASPDALPAYSVQPKEH